MQGDDDRPMSVKISGLQQNSRHALRGIGGEGEMKLNDLVCGGQRFNLWIQGNVGTFDDFQKIGARIWSLSASDRETGHDAKKQKGKAFHTVGFTFLHKIQA